MPIRVTLAVAALAVLAPGAAGAAEIDPAWLTPAERDGFRATPRYDETLAFIRRLAEHWPGIHLRFYGTSAAGRPLPLVIVADRPGLTPDTAAASGKPLILVQNGVHAGEIDGKDASLMILRDLALGHGREILEQVNLLILPIYNADGHERVSPHNRPNQNGPVAGMGFRTTADGHDLNRDHLKLDTPEARAVVNLFNTWRPHLHVDNHVTDGVDHDWVLNYSWVEAPQAAPEIDAWLGANMRRVVDATRRAGHAIGPYVSLLDDDDPTKGFDSYVGQPRYATGYYPLRNVPSILVETHSYKPYEDRVRANRAFLLALFEEVARDPASLSTAVKAAGRRTVDLGRADAPPSNVVLRWKAAPATERIAFPVYDWHFEESRVTGRPLLLYRRGVVRELSVPWVHRPQAESTLPRPRGYVVLPGWPAIERRLADHAIVFQALPRDVELDVETIRIANPRQVARSRPTYQGRTPFEVDVQRQAERQIVPRGSLWIPADQPDFEVAVQLLEPEAVDSLVSWGALSIVMERKEYIDPRVLEELARSMLGDPALADSWSRALEDPAFAADPEARRLWWYRRTKHWDDTVGLLPVLRVMRPPLPPIR